MNIFSHYYNVKNDIFLLNIVETYLNSANDQNKLQIYIKIFEKYLVNQNNLISKILKSFYKLK